MGLIAVLLLSGGCETANIPNVQFTASLGASGAETFDLLDSTTTTLTLQQFATAWDDLSNANGPLVCMRTADWASLKLDLEELCSWGGQCTTAQQAALTQFTNQLSNISTKDKNADNSRD